MSKKTKDLDKRIEELFRDLYAEHEKNCDIACIVATKKEGKVGNGMFGKVDDVVDIMLDLLTRGPEITSGVFDKIIKYAEPKSLSDFMKRVLDERPDVMRVSHVLEIPSDATEEQMSEMISNYTKQIKDEKRFKKPKGDA